MRVALLVLTIIGYVLSIPSTLCVSACTGLLSTAAAGMAMEVPEGGAALGGLAGILASSTMFIIGLSFISFIFGIVAFAKPKTGFAVFAGILLILAGLMQFAFILLGGFLGLFSGLCLVLAGIFAFFAQPPIKMGAAPVAAVAGSAGVAYSAAPVSVPITNQPQQPPVQPIVQQPGLSQQEIANKVNELVEQWNTLWQAKEYDKALAHAQNALALFPVQEIRECLDKSQAKVSELSSHANEINNLILQARLPDAVTYISTMNMEAQKIVVTKNAVENVQKLDKELSELKQKIVSGINKREQVVACRRIISLDASCESARSILKEAGKKQTVLVISVVAGLIVVAGIAAAVVIVPSSMKKRSVPEKVTLNNTPQINANAISNENNHANISSRPESVGKQVPSQGGSTISVVGATASSQLEDSQTKKHGNNYYSPMNTVDGQLPTAWSEGVDGNGVGQFIVYSFNATSSIGAIKIVNGYRKTDKIFFANCRLKRIRLTFDNGASEELVLADTPEWQNVALTRPYTTSTVRLTILDVYPGSKFHDAAFSDIQFLTASVSGFLLPASNQRRISENDLRGLSAKDIQLIRNEIFARHGRPFVTPWISQYFKNQSWYREDPGFTMSRLSSLELNNAQIIAAYEKKMGYR